MQAERSVLERMRIPIQKDPLCKKRNLTDAIFIILFGLFIILWIGAIAYVNWSEPWMKISKGVNLTIPTVKTSHEKQTLFSLFYSVLDTIDKIVDYACDYYGNSFDEIVWYIFAGQATLFAYFSLVKCIPKFLCLLALLYWIPIFFLLVIAVYEKLYVENHTLIRTTVMLGMIMCFFMRLAFFAINMPTDKEMSTVDVKRIVAKGLRSMFRFPSIFFFSFAIVLLVILLMVCTVPALSLLGSRSVLRYFILIGTMYVFSFICSFTNMVISQLVASLHWPPDSGENVNLQIFRCIKTVVRYHFGSIALSATGVFPFCLTIAALFKYKIPDYPDNFMSFLLRIYLILNGSTYAETMVAVHGYSYLQAIQQSFDSLIKKSSASLRFFLILDRRLILSHLVIALFTVPFRESPPSPIVFLEKYGYQFVVILILLSGFATFATMPILSSANATYACDLEDGHVEERSRRGADPG